MRLAVLRRPVVALCLAAALLASGAAGIGFLAPLTGAPVVAATEGKVPGNALGNMSDSETWRAIRQGVSGTVTIPDQKAALLVQSEGDNWRAWRNGPIALVGAIAFWVMFFVVYGFYIVRGPVTVAHGLSGREVQRFNALERFGHWLTAGSFLVLAATGVNMIYGRHLLLPLVGPETFSAMSQLGKYVHNYVGFAFITGLLLIFVLWVKDNLWDRYDWGWIKKGGGLLFATEHPPAGKFNFGQKTVFWAVILGGAVLSITGLNLLLPFAVTDIHQMQWIQAIHGTVSQVLCMLMVAHIYIGSVGMEGAFRAMSTGYVDENWAKEHHGAWFAEVKAKEAGGEPAGGSRLPAGAPAE